MSRRRLRFVLAMALAGVLPLSSFAQRYRHGGGSHSSAQLSALTCSQSTLSGAASDSCSVTLSAAASYRGATVSLSSSNAALAVPGSVAVPRGGTAATFTASASAVTSPQSVTLTASAGGTSATFVLTLSATGAGALTVNATQVAFGSVAENSPATQALLLSNSGTAALTIDSAIVTGKGFSAAGVSFPVTLGPKQSATLDLQFDPTAAGAASGTITINSNASNGAAVTISLSGTGQAAAANDPVDLNWKAPASSSDAVAGYNVYRATGSGSYQLLNTSVNQPTTYSDTTVQSGTTYSYEVKSVDASGLESTASNIYTVTLP
ncbi:MAG TPA: choice-of-anchor D domain-containing protein [Acidobacteriaceae bacterium]